MSSGLSLRELLDQSVGLVRRLYPTLLLPIAVPLALLQGVAIVLQSRAQSELAGPLEIALFVAGFFLTMSGYALSYYALQVAAVDQVAGRSPAPLRALLFPLRPRALGTILLAGFAVLFGTLFCLLPGIYLGLLLSVLVPVMVEEGRFGAAALRRCAAVTRFNPGRELGEDPRVKVLLLTIVAWLLGYVLAMLVQLPLMGAMMFLVLRSISQGGAEGADPSQMMGTLVWVQAPTAVIGALVRAGVTLYLASGVALLFSDVRRRMSGWDLERELDELAGPAVEDPLRA